MRSARHWDARLHALVGGLPNSAADSWLRRLTTAADQGVQPGVPVAGAAHAAGR